MSPAGICFAIATLLALAAGREVLVARAARRGVRNARDAYISHSAKGLGAAGSRTAFRDSRLAGCWGRVALWFDLPERLRRSGSEPGSRCPPSCSASSPGSAAG